ncbi:DEKNAAC102391 [Brettanomyces naardenensis]|uniref:DEKNAAC102391 n=1 Tax=Brettanomyces naardenensis TaxID=13370 RepID=A0A448YK50_BRENA|nr:DEKNAAC102391 [Brettanomyces naardenensis]
MAVKSRKKSVTSASIKANPSKHPDGQNVVEIKVEQKDQDHAKKNEKGEKKSFFGTRKFVFAFGILLGIVCAGYFGSKTVMENDIFPDLDSVTAMERMSKYWEDWKDVLPQGLQSLLEESEEEEFHDPSASFGIGKLVKKRGYEAKYNVIIVPGTTSSGIESWGLDGVEGCSSESYFRKRLWGSFFMVKTMVLDKDCWLKYVMLDPNTGLDPPGVKLRAAQGFEAADFFVTGYWIWNKVLQNLAVIGYGPGNMISASYDWRLAFLDLEIRDGYFTKLKTSIETMRSLNGQKTALIGHSMGAQVIFYFLKWVEATGEHFGNGGHKWVNENIEAFVDISGCLLGTPKAIVALLSGEMKDTIQMRGLGGQALEKFFSRSERAQMLQSWGGITPMLPKGGDLIWGNQNGAPDDLLLPAADNSTGTLGNFIRFTDTTGKYSANNLTVQQSIDFLLDQGSVSFKERTLEHDSTGYATSKKEIIQNEKYPNKWVNPLEVALPNAPDMKIFCFYGVGKPTERAYYYKEEKDKLVTSLNVSVDMSRDNSVLLGEGDGTVSLLTHYMCHKWAQPGDNMYNPGHSNVTIVEIKHEPDRFDIRGGAKTADHVDILGSAALNELLLLVASGHGADIQDVYVTHLRELAARIDATKAQKQ